MYITKQFTTFIIEGVLMFNKIKNIWRPGFYHGSGVEDNFFEGWFYKMTDKSRLNTVAIIPGIFISKDKDRAHSFIQVLHGEKRESFYINFNTNDFKAKKDLLAYTIDKSEFSEKVISLNIDNSDLKLKGEIKFSNLYKWPIKPFSPGVMGWYGFIPFMECNHGILSMNHNLMGELLYNDEIIDFDEGVGYIEKDWGSSFPSSYVWTQSNCFKTAGISFSASIAKIPWLNNWFRGFIIGLLYENKLYRFTTYTGAKLNYLKITDEEVEFEVYDKKHKIIANAKRTPGLVIHGPYDNQMIKTVSESLTSTIELSFLDNKTNEIIFYGYGTNAGLDVNGTLEEIIG
jgi:tocopherol cyclase